MQAQIEQQGRELDSWTKIVEKAVNAEAQANLQPTSYVKDMDQQCLRSNWPTTKASTKDNSMKDPRVDEPKARP